MQFPQRKLIRDMGYNYDYLGRRIQKFIADGIIDQGTVFEVPTVLLSKKREEEIRKFIGADSLGYISLEGMKSVLKDHNFCFACFTGKYPIDPTDLIEE